MDLKSCFDEAAIIKVAIIDDELSTDISLENIRAHNLDDAGVFSDPDDPDYQSLFTLLAKANIDNTTPNALAKALSDPAIRATAPKRLKDAAEAILESRRSMAEPVTRIQEWLAESGIKPENILCYSSPDEVDRNASFDLIFVDYYLVNNSKDQTLPLIKGLLDSHKDAANPLIVILMSSHADELRTDFLSLRPKLTVTGSRLRVMQKSQGDEKSSLQWKHALKQISKERHLVRGIESFLLAWGKKLIASTESLTTGLWSLDAQSLDILRQTAESDDASFSEYFSEVLCRKILAEVEESTFPEEETSALSTQLRSLSAAEFLMGSAEISDSRQYLRQLVGDIEWHRDNWWGALRSYPDSTAPTERFTWILEHIKFGVVLRHKTTNDLHINVTQPCDIAHTEFADAGRNHILLIPGELAPFNSGPKDGQKTGYSGAFKYQGRWNSIHWSLRRPFTPSIQWLIDNFESYEIIGQLRQDFTQEIVTKFASLSSRVATLRVPRFWTVQIHLYSIEGDATTAKWQLVTREQDITAHLISVESGNIVSFDPADAAYLVNNLKAGVDKEEALKKLTSGVLFKKSKAQIDGLSLFLLDTALDTSTEVDGIVPFQGTHKDHIRTENRIMVAWRLD